MKDFTRALPTDRKPRVLIVDDETDYCEAMQDVLENAGANVFIANDAYSAQTLFRLMVPDLLILDVMMPGMSGLELVGMLQAQVGWEQVPVIVASALAQSADRIAALDAGADAFLAKPFCSSELRAIARRFLPLAKTGELVSAA
jgi:DNA-binding response OmpR family regulator